MKDEQKVEPWFKFYPSDWRGDEKLRVCSLAARGLWIECLAIMHKAEPYGHLLLNGAPPSMQDLGRLVGCTAVEASRLLAELETKGVCDVTAGGVIVSRRMVRDKVRRERACADGKRGGNPVLKLADKPTLNGHVNGEDIPVRDGRARPDARDQKDQDQEHRARPARAAERPAEESEPDHRLLCALVDKELNSTDLAFKSEGEVREHLKGVAARAHLPYDGRSIGKALDAVMAAAKKRVRSA